MLIYSFSFDFYIFSPFFENILENESLHMQINNYENYVWISYSIPKHGNLSKIIENKKNILPTKDQFNQSINQSEQPWS